MPCVCFKCVYDASDDVWKGWYVDREVRLYNLASPRWRGFIDQVKDVMRNGLKSRRCGYNYQSRFNPSVAIFARSIVLPTPNIAETTLVPPLASAQMTAHDELLAEFVNVGHADVSPGQGTIFLLLHRGQPPSLIHLHLSLVKGNRQESSVTLETAHGREECHRSTPRGSRWLCDKEGEIRIWCTNFDETFKSSRYFDETSESDSVVPCVCFKCVYDASDDVWKGWCVDRFEVREVRLYNLASSRWREFIDQVKDVMRNGLK